MKRTTITLSDTVQRDLEDWADQQARPLANLISFLTESSIARAKESGEFQPRSHFGDKRYKSLSQAIVRNFEALTETRIPLDRLKSIRDGKRKPTELDMARIALALGVTEDYLESLPLTKEE